jgi:hypothetical protein
MKGAHITVGDSKEKQSGIGVGAALLVFVVGSVGTFIMGTRGLSEKWMAATIYCTAVPFLTTIFQLRKKVSPKALWTTLAGAFLVHVLLLWVLFGVILRQTNSVGLLVCLPGIFLEVVILIQCVKLVEKRLGANLPAVPGE